VSVSTSQAAFGALAAARAMSCRDQLIHVADQAARAHAVVIDIDSRESLGALKKMVRGGGATA
jgi:hypothetical protein